MQIDQVLSQLGLSDKEPKVYVALLKLPGAQPASLIANRAELNRTTTYKALMSLVKKGLVTKAQRQGVTCFFAEDPENRLKTMVEKQKDQLNEMSKTILETIPLLTMEGSETYLPKVRYYEGIEGIKQIYEAILKEEKDVYRYGDITKIYQALGVYTDEYIKKRNKLSIKTHAIMPQHNKKDLKKHDEENRDVLFIPEDRFAIDGEIRIFGSKVAIISLQKESPIAVLLESQTIANMFLSIFMLTWNDKD